MVVCLYTYHTAKCLKEINPFQAKKPETEKPMCYVKWEPETKKPMCYLKWAKFRVIRCLENATFRLLGNGKRHIVSY